MQDRGRRSFGGKGFKKREKIGGYAPPPLGVKEVQGLRCKSEISQKKGDK